ncbi:MAG TPA: hypothetical protein DIC35_04020 [Candidatus Moranbacteria bacterium]|nr:hypothetical protein [Candidatus Moranbacteria bacterium]
MEGLHLEILDENRRASFEKLAAFHSAGYLAGGTALALQLGHRLSYDFDIFSNREISFNFPAKVKSEFAIKETLVNNQDEFTFLTDSDIKISFIYYPFDLTQYIVKEASWPLDILSPLGVALTKAYTLNRRNSWRDYLDLYALLKNRITDLSEIVTKAQEVYGEIFNEKLFLAQLVYTEDIAPREVEDTPLFSQKIGIEEVKEFFGQEIEKYLEESATDNLSR